MIGQGADSFASNLHYPPEAKAAGKEGAVQFYCEVNSDGHARHARVIGEDAKGPFRAMVQQALLKGRFLPAQFGGHATKVLVGGTVLFVSAQGQPTIVVSLATAEKEKAAGAGNYIQPQMLMSYADLERKCMTWWRSLVTRPSANPAAEALFNVDENGHATGVKVIGESPGSSLGAVLLKACDGVHFIPAQANGKRLSGQFNLAIDFRMMTDPDAEVEGHLRAREQ